MTSLSGVTRNWGDPPAIIIIIVCFSAPGISDTEGEEWKINEEN